MSVQKILEFLASEKAGELPWKEVPVPTVGGAPPVQVTTPAPPTIETYSDQRFGTLPYSEKEKWAYMVVIWGTTFVVPDWIEGDAMRLAGPVTEKSGPPKFAPSTGVRLQ